MESLLAGIAAWMAQWSSMGGYAVFVWPAYAITGIVVGGLCWQSWRAHRVSETALDRLTRRVADSGRPRR